MRAGQVEQVAGGVEVEYHDSRIVMVVHRGSASDRFVIDANAAEDMAFSVLDLVASCRHGWAVSKARTKPKGTSV